MAVYGLARDLELNKGASLYIPGQTQLTKGDVFIGGAGTGITDDMIGPATRIAGVDAAGTARAYENFQKGQSLASSAPKPSPFESGDTLAQSRAIIANNAAPRSDAYRGNPSMGRLTMEQKQVQDAVVNAQNASKFTGQYGGKDTLDQKIYDHGVEQDAFSNEYNVGNMMGNYKGQDTFVARNAAIKDAQWDKTYDYNAYNDSANRAINQQNADNNELAAGITRTGGGTVSGGSMPQEYSDWVNDAAASNGIPPAILAGLIEAESSWNPEIVNKTSGATGLGQFLSTTAADEGLSNPTDAKSSIYAAAKYLAKRVDWAGGDLEKGIMGYGEGTTEYLNRVLGKSKNYTVSAGTKTIGTKPTDKINTNELVGRLNTLYTTKDSDGVTSVNQDTKTQLRAAIIGQGLPDDETDKLLILYGLPINN